MHGGSLEPCSGREAAAWLMYAGQMDGTLRQLIPELNRREQAILQWEKVRVLNSYKGHASKPSWLLAVQWPAPEIATLAKASC